MVRAGLLGGKHVLGGIAVVLLLGDVVSSDRGIHVSLPERPTSQRQALTLCGGLVRRRHLVNKKKKKKKEKDEDATGSCFSFHLCLFFLLNLVVNVDDKVLGAGDHKVHRTAACQAAQQLHHAVMRHGLQRLAVGRHNLVAGLDAAQGRRAILPDEAKAKAKGGEKQQKSKIKSLQVCLFGCSNLGDGDDKDALHGLVGAAGNLNAQTGSREVQSHLECLRHDVNLAGHDTSRTEVEEGGTVA